MRCAGLLSTALALAPVLAAAEPVACPVPGPRIVVTVMDPAPSISHDVSVDALHAQSGQARTTLSHHLGLTRLRVEWRTQVVARVAPGPEGVCAVVAEARLTLVHAEHRILIAREIPAGGCLYREVEEHERRHVAVNRTALAEAAPAARRVLEAWAAGAEARAPTAEAATALLREGLNRALEPVAAAVLERRAAAHRAIDTVEEYNRLYRSCALDQIRLQDRLRGP